MTPDQQPLFGGYDTEGLDDEQLKMSADRKRTLRQREALAHGSHPLGLVLSGHLQLHPEAAPYDNLTAEGRRCGNCRFRVLAGHRGRSWPKCAFGVPDSEVGPSGGVPLDRAPRVSHGGGTDVRAWWSACVDHQWPGGVS